MCSALIRIQSLLNVYHKLAKTLNLPYTQIYGQETILKNELEEMLLLLLMTFLLCLVFNDKK